MPEPTFKDTPIRPPFDPELVPVLGMLADVMPRLTAESLPGMRQTSRLLRPWTSRPGGAVVLDDRTVPGPQGAPDLTLLIMRPAASRERAPAIYHTHGGGMVAGHRRLAIEMFVPYVAEFGAVVVSVEYRLAPEHPDPAPVEDCYAGLVWTAKHAEELGIDAERIMIAGASSGGGLAAGTALLARDRGFPPLSHQVLICPMLDDRMITHSSRMLVGEGGTDRNDILFGWTSLLGERRGGPNVSPYAAPARARDLSGLPRTYLDAGSTEVFRDEVIDYATRLSQAGVCVDLHIWGGGFHGFDQFAPHAALSRASLAARDEYLRRALDV